MKTIQQLNGIVGKEIAMQYRSSASVISRLLIGPVISCATAGILYAGFFNRTDNLSLGPVNASNFQAHLILGFLVHTYLNAGYYHVFRRIAHEWHVGTLPLLWMAPVNRATLTLGLGSVELIRCAAVTVIGLSLLQAISPMTLPVVLMELVFLAVIFCFSLTLGFLKSALYVYKPGSHDLFDHAYLGFVFTSCLYIPKELLPKFLGPLCDLNPAYHAFRVMVSPWAPHAHWQSSVFSFLVAGGLALATTAVIWKRIAPKVLERSFA